MYTILDHPDFPSMEMGLDDDVHEHEHDGVVYKTMDFHTNMPVHEFKSFDQIGKPAVEAEALVNTEHKVTMTSKLILERFRDSKDAFEGRQKVKKEPELKKTNRDFIS